MGTKRRPVPATTIHQIYHVIPGEDFTDMFVVATSEDDAVSVYIAQVHQNHADNLRGMREADIVDIECLGTAAEICADLRTHGNNR